MASYSNATCEILTPLATPSAEDRLQRDRTEPIAATLRCSARKLGKRAEATVFGLAAVNALVVRIRTRASNRLSILPGYRLRILMDGESEWRDYIVRRASKTMHWELSVEGI
jgi:hypothetical protein